MEAELVLLRETKVMQQNKIVELDAYRRMLLERVDTSKKLVEEVRAQFLAIE